MYNVNQLLACSAEVATKIINDSLKGDFCIKHPLRDMATYPRSSQGAGMDHLILFSDELGDNQWILIQRTNAVAQSLYVDGLYYRDGFENVKPTSTLRPILERNINLLLNRPVDLSKRSIDGLLVSSSRPHHFIFDQYIHLLTGQLDPNARIYYSSDSFINKVAGRKFKRAQVTGCYLRPIISTFDHVEGYPYNEASLAALRKELITKTSFQKDDAEFQLWWGAAVEHRTLLNQVDCIDDLVSQLLREHRRVRILVDGITSGECRLNESAKEAELFEQIKSRLGRYGRHVVAVSLSGKTYREKIAEAINIDGFVAADGSSLIVPLVILNKPGVIHGLELDQFSYHKRLWQERCVYLGLNQLFVPENQIGMTPLFKSYLALPKTITQAFIECQKGSQRTTVDYDGVHKLDYEINYPSVDKIKCDASVYDVILALFEDGRDKFKAPNTRGELLNELFACLFPKGAEGIRVFTDDKNLAKTRYLGSSIFSKMNSAASFLYKSGYVAEASALLDICIASSAYSNYLVKYSERDLSSHLEASAYRVDDLMDCSRSEAESILEQAIKAPEFKVLHPLNQTVTYPRISRDVGYRNLILYSDKFGENRWLMVQKTDRLAQSVYVDGIFYKDGFKDVKPRFQFNKQLIAEFDDFLEVPLDQCGWGFDALSIASSRPHHFIFDQYIHVLHSKVLSKLPMVTTKTAFLNRVAGRVIPELEDSGCYIRPIISNFSSSEHYPYTKDSLNSLRDQFSSVEKVECSDGVYRLWFCISTEHRGLLNQIEVIKYFISRLLERNESIELILDGLTAPQGEEIDCPEEDAIVEKIKHSLNSLTSQLRIISLVGKDYPTKYAYGIDIDGFVAAEGSSLIVPLVLCAKRGLVHGFGARATQYHQRLWVNGSIHVGSREAFFPTEQHGFVRLRKSYLLTPERLFNAYSDTLHPDQYQRVEEVDYYAYKDNGSFDELNGIGRDGALKGFLSALSDALLSNNDLLLASQVLYLSRLLSPKDAEVRARFANIKLRINEGEKRFKRPKINSKNINQLAKCPIVKTHSPIRKIFRLAEALYEVDAREVALKLADYAIDNSVRGHEIRSVSLRPKGLGGESVWLAEELINTEYKDALRFMREALSEQGIAIKHPLRDTITYPRLSSDANNRHLILFSDATGGAKWVLIQQTGSVARGVFVDGLLYQGEIKRGNGVSCFNAPLKEKINVLLDRPLTMDKFGFDGFILSSSRPHHFLFDQYIHLVNEKELDGLPVRVAKNGFIKELKGQKLSLANSSECYLRPIISKFKPSDVYSYDEQSLQALRSELDSISEGPSVQNSITLWCAISAEKRGLINQAECIVFAARKILASGMSLALIIDGMTAPQDAQIDTASDLKVLDDLMSRLPKTEQLKIISAIGIDYRANIELCKSADAFVAAEGSALITPLVLCAKPGVVHGLGVADEHAKLWDGQKVVHIGKNEALVPTIECSKRNYGRSYLLPEVSLFNALVKVLDIEGLTEVQGCDFFELDKERALMNEIPHDVQGAAGLIKEILSLEVFTWKADEKLRLLWLARKLDPENRPIRRLFRVHKDAATDAGLKWVKPRLTKEGLRSLERMKVDRSHGAMRTLLRLGERLLQSGLEVESAQVFKASLELSKHNKEISSALSQYLKVD